VHFSNGKARCRILNRLEMQAISNIDFRSSSFALGTIIVRDIHIEEHG
jgi:hypothetical protein